MKYQIIQNKEPTSIVIRTNQDAEIERYPPKFCGCCGRVLE